MPGSSGPHHTDAWRRCIAKVDAKGSGNSYAICTASLQRDDNVYETREQKMAAAFDDANGDRGDVAEPAIHMPRSLNSRCAMCGKDMSARDAKFGGEACGDCATDSMDESGADTTGPRPGGWSRTDNKPQPLAKSLSTPARYARIPTFDPPKKAKKAKAVEAGGEGSGRHAGGGGLKAKIAKAAKFVKDSYTQIPKGVTPGKRDPWN